MARKKQAQQRPECWWCRRPEASNEDVVPLWVGRKYPEPANWIHESAHPELGHYRTKQARKPSVKTRKFCEKCNTGWMSRLEKEAIPLLEPMMHGTPARLTEKDQELLSLWVCKTIYAFQHRKPPCGSQIWLGSRDAGESVAWHRAHSLSRESGFGFGSTLALGAVVAHLIWHDEPDRQLQLAPNLRPALIQIWPVKRSTRLWPPPQRIGGRDLSWFARTVVAGSQLASAA